MVQVKDDHAAVRELRDEAIELCCEPIHDWNEGGKAYRDEKLARIAVATEDLGLAREIALVEWRTWASLTIADRRCDSKAIQSQLELARQINDPAIYGKTIKGIAKAVSGQRLKRQVYDLAVDIEDRELREEILAPLVAELRDPDLLRGKIRQPENRVPALCDLALHLRRVDLAREALDLALRKRDQDLLAPIAFVAFRLGDEQFLRRLGRLVPGIEDFELAIQVCDSLGGCDFRNAFSRRAYRMVQSLPEHDPGEDDDMEYDGSREMPLVHLALRHDSLTLARRLRSQYARDFAFALMAPERLDLSLAREIRDSTFYYGALASIASRTNDFELIDETITECREDEFADGDLLDTIITKLEMIRSIAASTLPLVF